MKLNDREKKLALATGIAFVLGVFYIGSGLLSDDSASSISNTTAAHFDDLFSKIDSVEAQKAKNGVYRKKLENDTAQFLNEKEKNNLWTEIEQVAQQSGMQLKGISPSLNMRARPLPKIDFTITAECQFEQVVQFLDKVRKAKYFIQPTSMKMSLKDKNQPVLSVQMTLTSYLLDKSPATSTSTSSIARGGE